MNIIPSIADESLSALRVGAWLFFAPEPRVVLLRAFGFCTSVFVFEAERNAAKEAGPFFADVASEEKGADILANTIVEVGVPPLDLFFERFPAHENVERRFAFENSG